VRKSWTYTGNIIAYSLYWLQNCSCSSLGSLLGETLYYLAFGIGQLESFEAKPHSVLGYPVCIDDPLLSCRCT